MSSVPPHSNKIGDILRHMGVLSSPDVCRILLEQQRGGQQFGEIAIAWNLASYDQISEAWARQLASEQRQIDLDKFEADPEAVASLSPDDAQRLRALPLRHWGSHLIVAIVSMPMDGKILEDIAKASGHRHVYPCFCTHEQLEQHLKAKYSAVQSCTAA